MMDRPKDILSSIYGVCVSDLTDREKFVKGIQECDLNGGLIGNCPYKGILAMLQEQEKEIENLKEIIKEADNALESIKERINEILYEDFRRK